MVMVRLRIVIMGLRMVSTFLIMARTVFKIGQMGNKMIVIRMVRMGREWQIKGCEESQDDCLEYKYSYQECQDGHKDA